MDQSIERGYIEQCAEEMLPRVITAREGSELAQRLRAMGWVARAGWRTTDALGNSVWQLRFEAPDDVELRSHVAT